MTIANQTNRISAVGSGSTGQEVPFSFPINTTSDLSVTVRTTADGAEVDWAETTNYTVSISGDTGGTLTTGGSLDSVVETTEEIHIIRTTPFTQSLDLVQRGRFRAEKIEDALDKGVKLAIDNKDGLSRALRAPDTDDAALDLTIPSSVDRASKVLSFDASGNATVVTGTTAVTTTAIWTTVKMKFPLRDVTAYGAAGNGTTDDTIAVQAAITAAGTGGSVYFPKTGSGYNITDQLEVANDMHIHSNGATVYMNFADAETSQNLFNVTSSDVEIYGIIFDGSKMTGTPVTTRRGVLFTGTSGSELSNNHIHDCEFNDMSPVDGTTYVAHCVYLQYSDNSSIRDCRFNTCSGAAIFIKFSDNTKVLNNDVIDAGWYPIHYDQDCTGFVIDGNRISGTTAETRNFGGSIDLMSQDADSEDPIRRGIISNNYITGYIGGPAAASTYPYAMRIASATNISITDNVIEGCIVGLDDTLHYGIFLSSRPDNAVIACKNISITGNTMIAGDKRMVGVYMSGNDKVTENLEHIVISNNVFFSPSTSLYFSKAVWLATQANMEYNIQDVIISGNVANGITGEEGSPKGMIAIDSDATSVTTDIKIHGNTLTFLGVATVASQPGIQLYQTAKRVEVFDNTINGFYNALRFDADNSDIRVRGNRYINSVGNDIEEQGVRAEEVHNDKYMFKEFVGLDNAVVMLDNGMVTINGSL